MLADLPERFTVEREIGHGGMATVYLAHDTVTQTRVALKVLHPHLRSDELIAERFRREIAAARRVRHPNVAEIHDLIETDQLLCLVVQYHDGIDVKRLLRRQERLNADDAVKVIGQVLDGLAAAHAQGVVHRDVKPHNILVDDELNVLLTDFGLARVDSLAGLTAHTMSLGTPEYMAPELFGSHYVDSRADIYAVGVTLFEMLTGKLPFRGSTPLALLDMHRSEPAPRLRSVDPTLPELLDELVARALAKAPEDRFATPMEMRQALDGERSLQHLDAIDGSACRSCGAPLPPGLETCVECGAEFVQLAELDDGAFTVFVPRPSNRITLRSDYFDNLTFEQKSALTDQIRAVGGNVQLDGEKLDQRLRSTPIVVGHRLNDRDAATLQHALATVGVDTRIAPANVRGRLTIFQQFGLTEDLFKTLLLGGVMAPLMSLFFVAVALGGNLTEFSGKVAVVIPMLVSVVLLGWVYRQNRRPLARFDGGRGALTGATDLLDRVRNVSSEVRSPRIRRLLRRILQRGLTLRQKFAAHDEVLRDAVDRLLLVALRTAQRVGHLEAENADIEPATVLEKMQALHEKIEVSEDVHETSDLIDSVATQRRLLETFDANYDEITRLTERLLEVSSELSRHLAEIEVMQADEVDLMSLSQVILDLGSEVEAAVELQEAVDAKTTS